MRARGGAINFAGERAAHEGAINFAREARDKKKHESVINFARGGSIINL